MSNPTIDTVVANGLIHDIGTLSLDRGYDYPVVRSRLAATDSTTLTFDDAAPNSHQARRTGSPSGCAGSSNQQSMLMSEFGKR